MTADELVDDLNRLLREGLVAVAVDEHAQEDVERFCVTPRGREELQAAPTVADSQVAARFPVTTREDLHVDARRLDRGHS